MYNTWIWLPMTMSDVTDKAEAPRPHSPAPSLGFPSSHFPLQEDGCHQPDPCPPPCTTQHTHVNICAHVCVRFCQVEPLADLSALLHSCNCCLVQPCAWGRGVFDMSPLTGLSGVSGHPWFAQRLTIVSQRPAALNSYDLLSTYKVMAFSLT